MLSLSSLAFILCSAIRRSLARCCSSLHCFPDRINGRKMATNTATNKATIFSASMCSLLRRVYTSPRRSRLGAQRTRLGTRATSPDSCNALSVEVRPCELRPDCRHPEAIHLARHTERVLGVLQEAFCRRIRRYFRASSSFRLYLGIMDRMGAELAEFGDAKTRLAGF